MKALVYACCLAALLSPAFAAAQTTISSPPPGPPTLTEPERQATRAAFQQFHSQEMRLRLQERAQMLAALMPAHRTLLANAVGQLALAANPDATALARQLDAVLTPAEQQAVLRAHQAFLTQSTALRQQFESQLPPQLPAHIAAVRSRFGEQAPNGRGAMATQDPGILLLRATALALESGLHHHPGF